MSTFRFAGALSALVVVLGTSTFALAGDDHGHKADVEVGRTDTGALGFVDFDFGTTVLEPYGPPAPLPFLPSQGWILDDPGWATLEGPEDGLLPLEAGATIMVEVISLSPALRMYDPAGGGEVLAGGQWMAGGNEFDAHPLWVIDATSPSFDPLQTEWFGSFRLIDTGSTGYTPSETHRFTFTTPEPASAALLCIGALFASRRARRMA